MQRRVRTSSHREEYNVFESFTDLMTGLFPVFLIIIMMLALQLLLQKKHDAAAAPEAAAGPQPGAVAAGPAPPSAEDVTEKATRDLARANERAGEAEARAAGAEQRGRDAQGRADAAEGRVGVAMDRAGALAGRITEVEGEIAAVGLQLGREANERRTVEQTNERLRSQVARLTRQLQGIGNMPLLQFSNDDRHMFPPNAPLLTQAGRLALAQRLPELVSLAERDRPTLLAVIGSTSPTPRRGQGLANAGEASDTNLDLSVQRATAVAHFFEWLGIPARCIIAQGNGFSGTRLPEEREEELRQPGSGLAERIEKEFADERAIHVVLQESASGCNPERLLTALRNAARQFSTQHD